MKRLFSMLVLFIAFSSFSQPPVPPGKNVVVDSKGNYREITDVNTGKTYIDKDGKSFPVFLTKNGKLYVITGISLKTGKPKKKYLKP